MIVSNRAVVPFIVSMGLVCVLNVNRVHHVAAAAPEPAASVQKSSEPGSSDRIACVYPPDVHLSTVRDTTVGHRAGRVCRRHHARRDRRARISRCRTTWLPSCRATWSLRRPTVRPSWSFEFGGERVVLPVEVRNATLDPPISFQLDVMPVFMKAGCNTGSCHGAARGKDGFAVAVRFRPRRAITSG